MKKLFNKNGCAWWWLSALILMFPLSLWSQSSLLSFSPGARSVGLGYSGVVQQYDPTALFWNPAAMAVTKHPALAVANHDPYLLNYLAYSHYLPQIGSLGIAVAHTRPDSVSVSVAVLGWGRQLGNSIYLGATFSSLKKTAHPYAALGFGVLYKPQSSLLHPPASRLSRALADRFVAGLSIQNIGLGAHKFTQQFRLGVSYKISDIGPSIVAAHHFSPEKDTDHFGLLFEPLQHFQVFAGFRNFQPDNLSIGVGFTLDNFTAQTSFDPYRQRLAFSTSVRIGPRPETLAERNYNAAKQSLRTKNKRQAVQQARQALAYNNMHKNAAALVHRLDPIIQAENDKIDSLLVAAYHFQQRDWYISAAVQYLKVLKIDPSNESAQDAIAMIRPKVKIHTERWYLQGVKYYNTGNMERAKEIFESIVLVRPDHIGSNNYLKKIREHYIKQAEQHYYAGLGYYSQRKLEQAAAEFRKALRIAPDFPDASEKLERIAYERQENRNRIDQLLAQARDIENRGAWKSAQDRYRQVLALQPYHEYARLKVRELDSQIAGYVNRYFARGERHFQNNEYAEAKQAFRRVLAMNEDHAGARRYIRQITSATSEKLQSYFQQAQELYNEGNYEKALGKLDSTLAFDPDFEEAQTLRDETLLMMNVEEILAQAIMEYNQEEYIRAMEHLNQVIEKDPNKREAIELRERCQARLNEKVDEYFNRGIQLYTEEKYQDAIEIWDLVLQINPYHKGADEYKKRAQGRLETLERLE